MAEKTAREPGHETRDVSVRVVTWFAIGLIISGICIFVAMIGLYRFFKHEQPSPEPPSRIAFHPQNSAPEPRLQTVPKADLERLRASDDRQLNSYGWIDKQRGIINIPIERAMELIAERGLPTRGPGTQNSSGKTPEQVQQEKAVGSKP